MHFYGRADGRISVYVSVYREITRAIVRTRMWISARLRIAGRGRERIVFDRWYFRLSISE